jgi:hypothetical protein
LTTRFFASDIAVAFILIHGSSEARLLSSSYSDWLTKRKGCASEEALLSSAGVTKATELRKTTAIRNNENILIFLFTKYNLLNSFKP